VRLLPAHAAIAAGSLEAMTGQETFRGEICGVGTTSGTRVVIGRWPTSPFGSFADVMVEHPDGRRAFIAPDEEIAAYVTSVYAFDDLVVAPVDAVRSAHRLRVAAGPLTVDAVVGRRDALGWVLRAVPGAGAASPAWATLVAPVARVVLRGVRTRGATPGGEEFYGATDRHAIDAVIATWEGRDLGPLAAVDPPVRFGFSSTPRAPSIVAVTTTVRRR